MLSVPFSCFVFLHGTYHCNVTYILLISLVALSQPPWKLRGARGFSSVHSCVPGSQKTSASWFSKGEGGTACSSATADWTLEGWPRYVSTSDAQLSLTEKNVGAAFSLQLLLLQLCVVVDDLILASAH